ncbi:MAG: PD-(D/E)XK nuclease family protein [Acidobacteriota bacterium]
MGLPVERNRLLQGLAAFCAAHPVDEKILLVPSFPAGMQILDALARSGCAHLNLRPATVFSLAHGIAGPALAADGKRLLSRAQLLAVVESACDEVLGADSYFGALRRSVGLHRALHRTLDELRRARVTPVELGSAAFDDLRKGAELAALAKAYEAILSRVGAADAAEVLERAAVACADGRGLPAAAHLLRPSGLELSPLEEAFLDVWGGASIPLAEDVFDPARPGAALTFAHALSEENEVRSVFRRILDEGLRVDEVEIVFDDDATYRPLVHELASQYGFPCTLEGGVPVAYTRPGQGILDVLDFVGRDFRSSFLERLFADGRADLGPDGRGVHRLGGVRAARLLRRARIVAGASRYAPRLEALVARERTPSEHEESSGQADAAREERLLAAEALRAYVTRLLAALPKVSRGSISLPALARSCGEIVRALLARASDLDGAAAVALSDLFAQLAELPERRLPATEAADRLREAVERLAVDSASPAPGHVHVARLGRAGWSGRPWTFVLGLDEARFPGPPRQDPVLLDAEREVLNRSRRAGRLALPGQTQSATRVAELHALLARTRGQAVLTFSNRDILQDSERFPSPALLALFRSREGTPEASWIDFARALPKPATFVPDGAPLDEAEWWLARMRETPGAPELDAEVRRAYPWLADGAEAEAARASAAFTAWDGRLSADPAELDPRKNRVALSASRLEKLAKCPRAYFYEYVLDLSPPDEIRREDEWLNAREFGNLLHETLYDFMTSLRSEDLRLDATRDTARLKAAAGRRLARWKEIVPPPNLAAFRAQEDELLAACDIFLQNERSNDETPRFFEVPFGLRRANRDEPLGSAEPVEIATPGGSFLLQGQIDRIDEAGPGRYTVWDYKSGGDFSFKEEERVSHPLKGGRLLQHALYRRAAARLLERAGVTDPRVTSGYFLTTRKGRSQRFRMEASEEVVDRTLDDLFALVSTGSFPHTADEGDCRFCAFRAICGNVAAVSERARAKRDAPEGDARLEPVRSIFRRGV